MYLHYRTVARIKWVLRPVPGIQLFKCYQLQLTFHIKVCQWATVDTHVNDNQSLYSSLIHPRPYQHCHMSNYLSLIFPTSNKVTTLASTTQE